MHGSGVAILEWVTIARRQFLVFVQGDEIDILFQFVIIFARVVTTIPCFKQAKNQWFAAPPKFMIPHQIKSSFLTNECPYYHLSSTRPGISHFLYKANLHKFLNWNLHARNLSAGIIPNPQEHV